MGIHQLTVSRLSTEKIIGWEVSSEAEYRKRYIMPVYPGAESGITVGIGYDLGYHTKQEITEDWGQYLSASETLFLAGYAGLKGARAKEEFKRMDVAPAIQYQIAEWVFMRELGNTAKKAVAAYPGLELLRPHAAGAIVSLVFNRGTAKTGAKRAEMGALEAYIKVKGYNGMAILIKKMVKYWDGIPNVPGEEEKRYGGLVERRLEEAQLVLTPGEVADMKPEEMINLTF